jgi:hypothetical protein
MDLKFVRGWGRKWESRGDLRYVQPRGSVRAGRSRSDLESGFTPSTALGERRNEPPGEGVVHGKDEEHFTVKLLVVQTPVTEEHHCVG